ncbi:hypothetical protein ARALYDRAFT_901447 [Arabidopsis lyrata subsp. lyrata]|uniref:TF-B3 domain-containing protein n=2 Tax=Arabidopsis lyrata subsp. lyrata TaxID=81972 RepID=D7LE94_ARALL|nr:hypothetical protein ARALYDRAFT_901447 [Arabidopsis lyrata subsp. lyrata]
MANQHFFKPLLPGFHSHLTIPVAFFFKNIEGRNEQKTAELRSDASNKTWKVKIDGQRLTNGWRDFALAHDLRIGDIIVFRQERDMTFHVTMLGPSCCEIQYVSCLDNQNNRGTIQRKKKKAESSLDLSCFVANVTPSNLRYDSLNLPMCFVRANGLDNRCGEMILINEKGRSWTVALKRKKSCATTYIRRGWRNFCNANGLRAGSFFTFKLIERGGTLGLRLAHRELEEEGNAIDNNQDKRSSRECTKKKILIWKASSLPSQNRFVTVTLTPYNVGQSKLWSTNLWFEEKCKRMRLSGGWKEFCYANGVKIGESIILEFLWEADRSSVLKFCSKDPRVFNTDEMRWMLLEKPSYASCSDLITFRGRFYAAFFNHGIFAIDPYSLEVTPLIPSELLNSGSVNDLVPSGNDALFLVEKIIPRTGVLYFSRLTLRVSMLDEEAGKWVEVSEIGDRLLVIGDLGNVCCSAKELPDGCGLSGNSIVFTHGPGNVTYSYKYGVHTGREEDDLNCWRYSREKPVTILSTSPVVALRVESAKL